MHGLGKKKTPLPKIERARLCSPKKGSSSDTTERREVMPVSSPPNLARIYIALGHEFIPGHPLALAGPAV